MLLSDVKRIEKEFYSDVAESISTIENFYYKSLYYKNILDICSEKLRSQILFYLKCLYNSHEIENIDVIVHICLWKNSLFDIDLVDFNNLEDCKFSVYGCDMIEKNRKYCNFREAEYLERLWAIEA